MEPPRFSLNALLLVIAPCGVAFASLASPSVQWANTLFNVSLGTFIAALPCALDLGMKPPRISIAALMATTAFVAIAFAALRYASDLWAATLFSATLFALGTATLRAAFRRGRSRPFCAGASVFGWGYMLLSFGPCAAEITPRLLSTRLLDAAYEVLHPTVGRWDVVSYKYPERQDTGYIKRIAALLDNGPALMGSQAPVPGSTPRTAWSLKRLVSPLTTRPNPAHFEAIGHSLFALLLALAGGLIARYFHATRGDAR